MDIPLVSCLCITNDRFKQLQTAIECFKGQTYANKELIIIRQRTETDSIEQLALYHQLNDVNVRFIEVSGEPSQSLGELRNKAIKESNGEYFCTWDDDDWHHARRIEMQVLQARTNQHPCSMITNLILYDAINRHSYFSRSRLWEGTVLCKKNVFSEKICYPGLTKGEDRQFSILLMKYSRIFPVISPFLYIYVYHGKNTWGVSHFDLMFSKSQRMDSEVNEMVEDILTSTFSHAEASAKLETLMLSKEINYFQYEISLLRERMASKQPETALVYTPGELPVPENTAGDPI